MFPLPSGHPISRPENKEVSRDRPNWMTGSDGTYPTVWKCAEPLKTSRKWHGEELTGAERVEGPLELLTRSKVLALGGDAFEIIRVVLEAVRGVRRVLSHRRWRVPMFGLVRLGEPGYDSIDQGGGAG